MSEIETPEVVELPKPSKLKRIKSAAPVVLFYGTSIAVTGAAMYFGVKTQKMQYDTAKLALEAAKTAAQD